VNLKLLNLFATAISDEGLRHLQKMTQMEVVVLELTKVTGPGFKYFANMSKLEGIQFPRGPKLTGEGMQHFANCPKMLSLDLQHMAITDEGLAQIKQLKQLRSLYLPPYAYQERGGRVGSDLPVPEAKRFTNVGLKHIGEMPNLELLRFSGSGITDVGYSDLAGLKNLTHLTTAALPNVKGPALQQIKNFPKLYQLDLEATGIDDDGMKHIKECTQVKSLSLPRNVTDACIEHLVGLTQLSDMDVPKGITDAGIAKLRQALQKTQINRNSNP
jgi:hypothetical protein